MQLTSNILNGVTTPRRTGLFSHKFDGGSGKSFLQAANLISNPLQNESPQLETICNTTF